MSNAMSKIDFQCLVSEQTLFKGDLIFSGGVQINGEIKGSIRGRPGGPTALIIGPTARVTGDILADNVVITGTVEGNVQANNLLKVDANAQLIGKVIYHHIEIISGAVVHGQLLPGAGQVTNIKSKQDDKTFKLQTTGEQQP